MSDKNGLIFENGERLFYKDGKPYHAGVIEWDGKIYYIGKGGRAVTGEHIVHGEMTNGLLERGTYTFDEEGVLIEGSFRAPRVHKRKRRRRRRQRGTRIKRGWRHMKKADRRRLIGLLAVVLVLVTAVTLMAVLESPEPPAEEKPPAEAAVILPSFEEEVLLCSEAAHKHYNGEIPLTEALKSGDPYRAFVFEYDLRGNSGELLLSEYADLSDAMSISLEAGTRLVTIDNLKTGTTYYYRVNTAGESYDGTFRTAEGTRFISLPGAYNIRDIGGYQTTDGRVVKQGLILRGTELDGLVKPNYYPTNAAIDAAKEQFGFVFDFDLREPNVSIGEYRSRFGTEHTFYSAPMYGNVFNSAYKESIRAMFADLADESRYPMYLHCTHGVDRSGTLTYLLLGVLGVPEERLMEEYRLSGYFAEGYESNTLIDSLVDGLQAYPGKTINEKIEAFLTTDIGVTKAQLDTIRRILLEEPAKIE